MEILEHTLLKNSIFLYNYLSIYGVDKFNTKADLLLLNFIKDILNFNIADGRIKENIIQCVESMYIYIIHSNPQLGYCRKTDIPSIIFSFDSSFDSSF